jgi:PAS domain S-box-containing protein
MGKKRPRTANGSVGIPEKKLLRLSEVNDNLQHGIFSSDRQVPLNALVQEVRRFFNAEACALFLVSEEIADELVIEASCGDLQPLNYWKGKTFKIQSVPKGGLTSHIAGQKSVVALSYDQLKFNQFVRHTHQEHLVNGTAFSYLGIPLRDRKQRLLGVLTLDNRKNPAGHPDSQTFFDRTDRSLAAMLANKIVFFLENLRCFNVFRGIMEDIQEEAGNLDRLLHCLLKRAVVLLRADRGDFALWDFSKRDLFIRAIAGPIQERTLGVGNRVPEPSFMRMVWAGKGEADLVKWCPDVNEIKPYYYRSNHRTKSEIAVRFVFKGRPRGVLNVESFQRNGFDDEDTENLMLLARYAAIAVEIAEEESHLGSIIQRVFDDVGPSQTALRSILDTVMEVYGFQAGLIYTADNDSKMLRCRAALGCDELAFDPTTFSIPYGETSAATTVLHTKEGFFSADPANDPGVYQRGRRLFKINTPLVGVPLIFGDVVVGVLIAWGAKAPPPTREHITRLKPLAKLAAWKLAVWESQRRLYQTEDLYRSLVESLPKDVFLLRKDVDGHFTFANGAFLASLGVPSVDKLVGKTDADFYPPELAAKYRRDDEEVVKKGQPISGRLEGHVFPATKRAAVVMVSKTPVRDELDRIIGVQGIFWDITEHHTLEQRFRQLVDLSMNAILVHDGKRITFANPACVALLGARSRDELVGRDVLKIVHKGDQALVKRRIHNMQNRGNVQRQTEEKWLRLDGTLVYVDVVARPFFSVKGFEVLVVAQDITRWKRAKIQSDFFKKALAQSSKPKQVFVCYSHKDERHKVRLCTHLAPLKSKGINVWVDTGLHAGDEWYDDILGVLARAGAAVLLVSADFQASRFITEVELPILLEAARRNQTQILPVAVSRCNILPELAKFQFLNDPDRPLEGMRTEQKNAVWQRVVRQVEAALGLDAWAGA